MGRKKNHSEMDMPKLDPFQAAAVERFLAAPKKSNVTDKGGPVADAPARPRRAPKVEGTLPVAVFLDEIPVVIGNGRANPFSSINGPSQGKRCLFDKGCDNPQQKSGFCLKHYKTMGSRAKAERRAERDSHRKI